MGTRSKATPNVPYDYTRYFRTLPPIQLAEQVEALLAQKLEPQSADDECFLFQHTQALSIEAQHTLVGLPEAILGTAMVLNKPMASKTLRAARAVAAWACAGSFGTEPLSTDWLTSAFAHVLHTPHTLLPRHVFGEPFFAAVRYFNPRSPAPFLYANHGFIFPSIDHIDWIFRLVDIAARRTGGQRILRWCNDECQRQPRGKVPYSLLVNYGAKYIRTPGNPKALGQLEQLSKHLYSLLRLDTPPQMDPIWANPAFLTEDLIRGLMHSRLGTEHLIHTEDQLSFTDFLFSDGAPTEMSDAGTWSSVRSIVLQPPGTRIDGDPPHHWTHCPPAPNSDFGTSLQSALYGDLRKRPFIKVGRVTRVAPRPSGVGLIEGLAETIGIRTCDLGPYFEEFTRRELSKFRSLTWGDYYLPQEPQKHGDIDSLLHSHTENTILIFEMKAINEHAGTWQGGPHAHLDIFRKVFLKSAEQLLRAERALREHIKIIIRKDEQSFNVSVHRDVKIIRCTVSMSSFGTLHRPRYGGMLLSHLAQVKIGTIPSTRLEKEFEALQQKILLHRQTIEAQAKSQDILDNTVFLNMSSFLGLVRGSSSEDVLARRIRRLQDTPVYSQVISI